MIAREVNISSDAAHLADLRRCEDLFFALELSQLVRLSTEVIEQNGTVADPYAYRSFARLGESQMESAEAQAYGLVELLRDYFRACEQPVVTEGASVCRLILKLVFADLIRKISHARPGEKFTLQKTDPLCGGAFAILEGDFERARRNFGAAILDPECRTYAYAGIGLLKAINSDLPDALRAFADAESDDEDVRALIASLQPALKPVHA